MIHALKKIIFSEQIFAFLGPVCTILSLSLLFFPSAGNHFYLPYLAPIGLVLCYFWDTKGLGIAYGILAAIVVYNFSGIPTHMRFWELGVAGAISLGFLITALTQEVIEEQVHEVEDVQAVEKPILFTQDDVLKIKAEGEQKVKELEIRFEDLQSRVKNSEAYFIEAQNSWFAKESQLREDYQDNQVKQNNLRLQLNDYVEKERCLKEELIQKDKDIAALKACLAGATAAEQKVNELEKKIYEANADAKHIENIYQSALSHWKNKEKSYQDQLKQYQSEHELVKHQLASNLLKEKAFEETVNLKEQALQQFISDYELLKGQLADSLNKEKAFEETLNSKEQALQQFISDYELLKGQLADSLNKEKAFEETLNSKEQALQQFISDYELLKGQLADSLKKEKTFEETINSKEQALQQFISDYELMKGQLADSLNKEKAFEETLNSKEQVLQRFISDHELFKEQLADSLNKEKALKAQIFTQEAENRTLKENLEQIKKELLIAKQGLEEASQPLPSTGDNKQGYWQEWRKSQGLYLQLRQQFEEKGNELDKARHALFHAEEKLEKLKREHEEAQFSEIRLYEESWLKYLSNLDSIIQTQNVEIEALNSIVTTLSSTQELIY